MDLIRCPRCAKEVPETSQYCRRCGYTIALHRMQITPPLIPVQSGLGIATARPATLTQPRPVIAKQPARRIPKPQTKRNGGGMGVLCVLAVCGLAGYFRHHTERPATLTPLPAFRPLTIPNPPTYFPNGPAQSTQGQNPPRYTGQTPMTFHSPPPPPAPPTIVFPQWDPRMRYVQPTREQDKRNTNHQNEHRR